MAIGDPYATLDDLKNYLSIDPAMTIDDEALTDALASASTEIEKITGRQFNKATSATPRVFAPMTSRVCHVDDFWTASGLVVETDPGGIGDFSVTWAAPNYELFPLNGIVEGQPGWPYHKLRAVLGFYFPKYVGVPAFRREAVVRVTAQWGWDQVPSPVKQACLIMAAETFKLKDAPFGVAGAGEFGAIRVRNNPMAMNKLVRYIRQPVRVG